MPASLKIENRESFQTRASENGQQCKIPELEKKKLTVKFSVR